MLRGRASLGGAALAAAVVAALSPLPVLAQVDGEHFAPGASCPPGSVAGHAVTADWDTFFECNGSSQMQRGPYFFGSSSDTCNSSHEGLTRYDSTAHGLYYCNGTAWTQVEPVQSTPVITAPAGSGYFVLTGTTYNGNLGDFAGADASCLTELKTTHTSWLGYATANSNGQLVAGKVHAFLCNPTACNNLMPLTTYYFANAGNSSAGGASFTTNSSGQGPGDSNSWAAANYFSGTYMYWSNRGTVSATVADATPNCATGTCACDGNWAVSVGWNGAIGNSSATDSVRWAAGLSPSCTTTEYLICYVNP